MNSPTFVCEEGYLLVFSTREAAESYCEAQFVVEYDYEAYGSDGYQLELTITPDRFVAIKPMIPPVNKSDELRELIQKFLRIGETPASEDWLTSATLEELVEKALEYKLW